jgi:hypothetical protein
MIELEEERFHRLQDPAVPFHGFPQDFILGIHGNLVYSRLFQVAPEGIGIENFLGKAIV